MLAVLLPAIFVPMLFCGGGMVLCMWLMQKGMRSDSKGASGDTDRSGVGAHDAQIAQLRAEVDQLRAERRADDSEHTA